jgi:hypothetical protein
LAERFIVALSAEVFTAPSIHFYSTKKPMKLKVKIGIAENRVTFTYFCHIHSITFCVNNAAFISVRLIYISFDQEACDHMTGTRGD